MTTPAEQLALWRTLGARNSEKVVKLAPAVLASSRQDEWAVREQLAIAALDIGRLELAKEQITTLQSKFPSSPRVDILHGLLLEANNQRQQAKEVYQSLLKQDSCNVTAWARLIAMQPATEAITLLLQYLDIFYSDPQAWSLLADLYADQGAYAQSMSALGHLMILQTWDSLAVERAAETAYTMGDFQLALKYYLRAVEMETEKGQKDNRTRAWWGVKRTASRLLASPTESAVPDSETTPRDKLEKLEALATERILAVSGAGLPARRAVLASRA